MTDTTSATSQDSALVPDEAQSSLPDASTIRTIDRDTIYIPRSEADELGIHNFACSTLQVSAGLDDAIIRLDGDHTNFTLYEHPDYTPGKPNRINVWDKAGSRSMTVSASHKHTVHAVPSIAARKVGVEKLYPLTIIRGDRTSRHVDVDPNTGACSFRSRYEPEDHVLWDKLHPVTKFGEH
jgi:hypothetical protein